MAEQKVPSPFVVLILCVIALSAQACAEDDSRDAELAVEDIEAVQIWAHPDTLGIDVYAPLDLKAESRSVVWGIDGVARGVARYNPSAGRHGIFGFRERPPVEVVKPARLALAENTGIFVYDDSTGMLDLYSSSGKHLRGFDPGLRPSILEVARQPLRLTYGVRMFADDTVPTLSVIQTDFLGRNPDTLLSSGIGPASLRAAPAVRGRIFAAPAISGLWIFARATSDTVFELSASDHSSKLILPETDSLRTGVLADLQQEILWVVTPRPGGGLEYEAYDISDAAEGRVIDGGEAYLGARTTPPSFAAKTAFDGTVAGWWHGDRGVYSPRGYDMRVEDLRQAAAYARENRAARRAAITEEWTRALQATEQAGEQVLEKP
jgi:hypothetical protein